MLIFCKWRAKGLNMYLLLARQLCTPKLYVHICPAYNISWWVRFGVVRFCWKSKVSKSSASFLLGWSWPPISCIFPFQLRLCAMLLSLFALVTRLCISLVFFSLQFEAMLVLIWQSNICECNQFYSLIFLPPSLNAESKLLTFFSRSEV